MMGLGEWKAVLYQCFFVKVAEMRAVSLSINLFQNPVKRIELITVEDVKRLVTECLTM